MIPESDTVVSCLTPVGVGAIAVLALHGQRAWSAVRVLFRPASNKPLPEELPEAGTIWFGHFGGDGLADEVVVTVKQTTPQPWLEVHCHGGRQVVDWLIELLPRYGIQPVDCAKFIRLVEPGVRADAQEGLARAETIRTAAILLDLVNGAMDRAWDDIRTFVETGETGAAVGRIDRLLAHAQLASHLTFPWNVVVAGAPNVGKSSLVNALAGFRRSVVAPVPGTTRDVVSVRLAIDGWPVALSDTAGLRDEATGLESAGVTLARSALTEADLILWVLDSTADPVWPDAETAATRDPLFVVNKTDQTAAWDASSLTGAVFVSAQSGAGIPGLCAAISNRLVPNPPSPGEAVPFPSSVHDCLKAVRRAILSNHRDEALQLLTLDRLVG